MHAILISETLFYTDDVADLYSYFSRCFNLWFQFAGTLHLGKFKQKFQQKWQQQHNNNNNNNKKQKQHKTIYRTSWCAKMQKNCLYHYSTSILY